MTTRSPQALASSVAGGLPSLHARSDAQRERVMAGYRDELTKSAVSVSLDNALIGRVPLLGWLAKLGVKEFLELFGFDPFSWINMEANERYDAELADPTNSDRSIFTAMDEAGMLFIKAGHCPPLNHSKMHYQETVNNNDDVARVAKAITEGIRTLRSYDTGENILLNANDLIISLADVVKSMLRNSSINSSLSQESSFPILKDKRISWVKYSFSSSASLKEACCGNNKIVKMDVKIYWYSFPDARSFGEALLKANQ